MHDVLSNRCRRAVLYHLQDERDPIPVSRLARRVGARGGEGTERSREASERTHARIRRHVLKMEEFGLLGYDPDDETVWIPDDVTITVSSPGGVRPDDPVSSTSD